MTTIYAWIDGAVVDIGSYHSLWCSDSHISDEYRKYIDTYLVDTGVIATMPLQRYGKLVTKTGYDSWKAIPPDTFPPEFKVNLLLLGVPF